MPDFKTEHNYLEDKGLFLDMIKMEGEVIVCNTQNEDMENAQTLETRQDQTVHLINFLEADQRKSVKSFITSILKSLVILAI